MSKKGYFLLKHYHKSSTTLVLTDKVLLITLPRVNDIHWSFSSGIRGLILAMVLAAMMSSLSSVFNSVSSNITMNLVKPCISGTCQRPYRQVELMVVGRVISLLMAGVSIAWLPVLDIMQV